MVVAATNVVNMALRQIGAYSVYDSGADPSHVSTALDTLKSLINELVGTESLWFFVPSSQSFDLQAGVGSYKLATVTSTNLQFITDVQVEDSNGNRSPVELITHKDWLEKQMYLTGNGDVDYCYVTREDNPTLYVLRPPAITGYRILITGQKYAPNVTSNGGQIPVGFPEAWERFLYKKLAYDLGSGIIVRLPEGELDRLKGDIIDSSHHLIARNNRENVNKPRYTKVFY